MLVSIASSHIISYERSVYKNLEDKVRSSDLDFIRNKLIYKQTKKPIYKQLGWRADIYTKILTEECKGDESLAKSRCYEGRVYQIWKLESAAGRRKDNVYYAGTSSIKSREV
jgi:hypothetical protein